MSIYLREMLPYDPSIKKNGEADKGLQDYAFLMRVAKLACTALLEGDLKKFDALVGENACQIRAFKVVSIASSRREEIRAFLDRMPESGPSSIERNETLEEKLKGCDIRLSEDVAFLIDAFLLNVAKIVDKQFSLCRNERGDPAQLVTELGGITKAFATRVTRMARQRLSKASVNFVQEQADQLDENNLQEMCSKELIYKSWASIPMFWTYKTLLLAAKDAGLPLIFRAKFIAEDEEDRKVNQAYALFQPFDGKYEAFSPSEEDDPRAAIRIDGMARTTLSALPSVEQWRDGLSENPVDIILAGAADHRQYPDESKDALLPIDERFLAYKRMANEKGCCDSNQSLFFIQHVYPITIEKIRAKIGERT